VVKGIKFADARERGIGRAPRQRLEEGKKEDRREGGGDGTKKIILKRALSDGTVDI